MRMHFMDKLIKVVLMPCAQIDEALHSDIRVRVSQILTLGRFDDFDDVVEKGGEVCDGAVDVCGFVDAHEGFVEDGEEIAEELQGDGFFDDGEHLGFVAVAGAEFEVEFELGVEFGAFFHFIVDLEVVSGEG